MYKTNQLTGHVYNDSEVTIKVKEDTRFCYAKNVFLLGKINNVIVSLRPFGPFLLTEMTHFHTLSNLYPFLYLKPKKGTPLAQSLPM